MASSSVAQSPATQSSPSPSINEIVRVSGTPNTNEETPNTNEEEEPRPSTGRPPKPLTKTKKKRAAKSQTKKSVTRSWVWDHFEKIDKPLFAVVDGNEVQVGTHKRAKCRYCSTDLACDSSFNGTSTLRRHIETVCKLYPGRIDLDDGQKVITSNGTPEQPNAVVRGWTQEACVTAYCEMIVLDELPFSAVEKEGFRRFCSVAVPRFVVPSRRTIVRAFLEMYDDKREKLRHQLNNNRVCLTTDTWTSVQNINYMVLTAHFIDGAWKMHKRILNFCVILNHQGLTIGKILESCLVQWKIDKVLTVSVDNAASNKGAIDFLGKKMAGWKQPPVFGGKYLHVRCLAHILNLIVKAGLKLMHRLVAAIRNAVKYVRSSSARLDCFKMCVEKEKLESKKVCILDVPTRWNSTYLMLETALELRQAFDRMAEEEEQKYFGYFNEDEVEDDEEEDEYVVDVKDPKISKKRVGPPVDVDWQKAEVFVKFLKVFYDVTMRISASNKPTAQKAFRDIVVVQSEINALYMRPEMQVGSEMEKVLNEMAVKMKVKFTKYFKSIDDVNQLLLVALVLNPRFKLRNFSYVCSKRLHYDETMVRTETTRVKELLVGLCDLYASSLSVPASSNIKSSSGSSTCSSSKLETGQIAEMLEDWEKELENTCEIVVESELTGISSIRLRNLLKDLTLTFCYDGG